MLLTLALPIYNGEKCIESSIRSIEDSLLELNRTQRDLVEVIISDNKSTDLTQQKVEEFIDDVCNIKYFLNNKNLGYDGNIDILVQRAKGKYIWFIGCGERLKIDSLQRLIDRLNNDEEYSNILVDFDIYDEREDKVTDTSVFHFKNDVLITGKNDFTYLKYAPAVSSNIVNRNKWIQVKDESLVVEGWCHIERILSIVALDENAKTLFLLDPYFTLFREKGGWWTKPGSYLLLLSHIKVIQSMYDKGYAKKVVKSLEKKQSRIALLMAIVQSKEYGMQFNLSVLKKMLEIFKYDYFFWLFAFPLFLLPKAFMFIPRALFSSLLKIKKIIINVKKNIS